MLVLTRIMSWKKINCQPLSPLSLLPLSSTGKPPQLYLLITAWSQLPTIRRFTLTHSALSFSLSLNSSSLSSLSSCSQQSTAHIFSLSLSLHFAGQSGCSELCITRDGNSDGNISRNAMLQPIYVRLLFVWPHYRTTFMSNFRPKLMSREEERGRERKRGRERERGRKKDMIPSLSCPLIHLRVSLFIST